MRRNKDHTKLICAVGELAGLFTDSTSLEIFLQKIVEMISEHMHSEVCSIYLFYEDTQELVLKATKGLNSDFVGKVKLKYGEGLTGLAVKELRSISERNASNNPSFKYFPGLGEERFESFLVVPILRGTNVIGAIVVQNLKKNYFFDEDKKVLGAITSQLANTIETAKLLITLDEKHGLPQKKRIKFNLKTLKGKVGSEGFAFAPAIVYGDEANYSALVQKEYTQNYTLDDFQKAILLTESQLESLQNSIEEQLSDVASLIFTAQILMLKDRHFMDAIRDIIAQGINPPHAIIKVVESYVARFQELPTAYLREKGQDVRDIGKRLLENLVGIHDVSGQYKGRIVIAEELYPSDILKLASQNIEGIIMLSGGVTSHLSILTRSLQIPMVIANDPQILHIPQDTQILLDGEQGQLTFNPTKRIVDSYQERIDLQGTIEEYKKELLKETKTKDGTRIIVQANVNLLNDANVAREFNLEGVGLYRTEFPFIVRSDFPSEEEQFVIYKKLVEKMKDQEITFRTLDIGGDKVLSYYQHHAKEENPFLGMRSIRFSLQHIDIFSQQLRAILRAGAQSNLRIMFPMISSLDEFIAAKDVVHACMRELKKERIDYHKNPAIGMMIELPAVIEIIDDLAREADFFSIGTNDFIQYMLAVDRTNEKVADLYLPHHPSILRAFKRIVTAARQFDLDVSICGDMAQDERFLDYFIGIGIRKLSVDPRYFPKIQKHISKVECKKAEKLAESLLSKSKLSDIEKVMKS